jgi:oligopeptide transport system substrate-binding protein
LLVGIGAGTAAIAPASASSSGATLRIAVQQPPDPFDPATLGDNRTIELAQNVFDGLTGISAATGEPVPAIASSWSVSSNGLVYVFHLRSGVTFSNGDPVTAQDFVYSWNRTLSPKIASPYEFFLSGIAGANAVASGKAKTASGIQAPDSHTLKVTLSAPAGYFPELVSRWPFWVVDPRVVTAHGTGWVNPPNIVGTGGYELTSQVSNLQYGFTANPHYYAGAPRISKVQVNVVADPTTAVARYQANEFDVVFGLDAAALRQAQGDATLRNQLHAKQQLGTTWLGLNNAIKPLNDARVRRAISEAINRQALITVALGGLGHPTGTFLPPGLPGAIANTSSAAGYAAYDPTQAKALLAQAGYANGNGFPHLVIATDNVAADQTAMQFVQAELQQNLGIDLTIKALPQTGFNALFNNVKTEPAMWDYHFSLDYPDAQEMLQYFATSGPLGFVNYEQYHSSAFDALINKAITLKDLSGIQ